jgi:NADPH:quinone reductase-like Zn-dependent oxidoreductase
MTKTHTTMKVGFVEAADVFVFKQIERPTATPGTIILKNYVSGVNFADGWHIKGTSPMKKPYGIVGGEWYLLIENESDIAN